MQCDHQRLVTPQLKAPWEVIVGLPVLEWECQHTHLKFVGEQRSLAVQQLVVSVNGNTRMSGGGGFIWCAVSSAGCAHVNEAAMWICVCVCVGIGCTLVHF